MRKKSLIFIFVVVFATIALLSGCNQRSGINSSSTPESNSTVSSSEKSSSGEASSAAESSKSSEPSVSSAPSNQQMSESSVVEERPGFFKHSTDDFSLWLPDTYVVKENTVFEVDSEMDRTVAVFTSVEAVSDEATPFDQYDQLYSNAEVVAEVNFGEYLGKSYLIQESVSEGGLTGIQNTIIYCIDMDNQMITIEFYPARGMGGISAQREAFESVLDSIQAE